MSKADEEVLVRISGLVLDPDSKIPIVILRDAIGGQILPIWIGAFEAHAIALSLEGEEAPRPMTHDLLLSTIRSLAGKVSRVVISGLQTDTFLATIHIQCQGSSLEIDARPSDAVALALRADAPCFVTRSVLDAIKGAPELERSAEKERLKKWLEEVNPDELGKYTM